LGLFPSHFCQICQGFVNLVYFFKEPFFFVSLVLYMLLMVSISLISALIIISLLLVLGLDCSHFSRSLRCSIRLFIWDISVFLIYALMFINFPLRTAFAGSHRCFHFL
jgi:hypothetical protein